MTTTPIHSELDFLNTDLKAFTPADKALVIHAANAYTKAKRTADMNAAAEFTAFYNALKQVEATYNIAVFDGTTHPQAMMDDIAADIDLATARAFGPRSTICRFANVEHANHWLAHQRNIVPTNISIESHSHFGTHVDAVIIEYTTSCDRVSQKFAVDVKKKSRIYVKSDFNKVRAEWEREFPNRRWIRAQRCCSGGSLIGGSIGYFRYISETYFVLYAY
ncbi:MAG: hypothetical protein IKV35_04625 [Clostridia bacterium]|nr:hypothetical protein [Clostridia bacterium]